MLGTDAITLCGLPDGAAALPAQAKTPKCGGGGDKAAHSAEMCQMRWDDPIMEADDFLLPAVKLAQLDQAQASKAEAFRNFFRLMGVPLDEPSTEAPAQVPADGRKGEGEAAKRQAPLAEGSCTDEVKKFEAVHKPPEKPKDSFFKLELTTMLISGWAAAAEPRSGAEGAAASVGKPAAADGELAVRMGNHLLDLFDMEFTSTHLKVNHQSFSVKACIFEDDRMCTIRAQGYSKANENGDLALEWQRRNGDCVTFNSAYGRAVKFFQKKGYIFTLAGGATIEVVLKQAALLGPPALADEDMDLGCVTEAEIQPLLEMAMLTSAPGLQAEAVRALLDIAKERRAEAKLCGSRAVETYRALLQSTDLDVAYPTAKLLHRLARSDVAVKCFANGLLGDMLKVLEERQGLDKLVRQELRAALKQVICDPVRVPGLDELLVGRAKQLLAKA